MTCSTRIYRKLVTVLLKHLHKNVNLRTHLKLEYNLKPSINFQQTYIFQTVCFYCIEYCLSSASYRNLVCSIFFGNGRFHINYTRRQRLSTTWQKEGITCVCKNNPHKMTYKQIKIKHSRCFLEQEIFSHCLVLVGFRNGLQRDLQSHNCFFIIELKLSIQT